ncbi:hypothetical protein P4H39_30650 [Paenibacillus lautus]|uniref:hypothetical protein n=1 Tax=Paenibacillus lautus TaxID=1401 RepID=UPI002DC05E13|nr:hypothetical protein [Paenibacillus lautus]MEC0206975.1 hypothetical protein [Paenibacillus lautus]
MGENRVVSKLCPVRLIKWIDPIVSGDKSIVPFEVAILAAFQVSQNLLVGLFLWSFYDGGSRENVAALGAMIP